MKTLYLLTLLLFTTSAFAQINRNADIETHFRINGIESGMLKPGVPGTIEVWYTDKQTGEVFKDFKLMHGKIMHMVIMRSDLSIFKHIHPYLDPVTGRFMVTVNMPLDDPDNFQTTNTITTGGMFMVMADVDIRHVGMRMGHKMVHSMGAHQQVVLKLDPINARGIISKKFTQYGIDYKVKMKKFLTAGCSGNLVEFQVELFKKDEQGVYNAVTDAQDWLTQGAHSVWASQGLMKDHHMYFAHMHSDLPVEGTTEFVFNFHDNNIMKPGIQKVWFQIKHQDKVLTIPFVFDYMPKPEGC